MDLHIKDRLLIPSIFPERGNFMDFNLKKSIARKIAISEQDRKDYEIVEKRKKSELNGTFKRRRNPISGRIFLKKNWIICVGLVKLLQNNKCQMKCGL